jgi:hypothetical protein
MLARPPFTVTLGSLSARRIPPFTKGTNRIIHALKAAYGNSNPLHGWLGGGARDEGANLTSSQSKSTKRMPPACGRESPRQRHQVRLEGSLRGRLRALRPDHLRQSMAPRMMVQENGSGAAQNRHAPRLGRRSASLDVQPAIRQAARHTPTDAGNPHSTEC